MLRWESIANTALAFSSLALVFLVGVAILFIAYMALTV